ncbi:MAG: phage-shock protein [Planctomycetes bacterium]|nr:phage-shock protein [Planctomycetota bacterium]
MFDMGVDKLAVLLIFGVPIVAIIGGIFLKALKIVFGDPSQKKSNALNGEETKIIQEIYQGLERMEKRIEALETLMTKKD